MLFVTGPVLLLRIPSPAVRAAVKTALRPVHKMLGAIL